ncbi:hypothetical protein LMG26858_00880 [Achromobacter anxifer]|uniref:Uncharacterized protein n=1 Tax=Achromobacter anxifer TaxID=1287737 RepID=A0A6S7DRM5_9BURK|nr:hypothetical protein [Achromobacter anxifer]CAB3834787.1 hypothetical protein LMG26858_00880 [Achromobacter anxifer]
MENQIFRGQVGQATAGDIVNFNFGSVSGSQDDGGSLVPAQRKALHQMVRTITDEFDDEAWDVWRIVHAKLGVTTVHELTRNQFQVAEAVLKDHLQQRREESLMRGLVAKVLRVASEKDNRPEVELFCSRNFGTSQLKLLTTDQLKVTLGFAHDWSPPKAAAPAPHASVTEASLGNGPKAPAPMISAPVPSRLFTWHWLAGGVVLGFVLGRFF